MLVVFVVLVARVLLSGARRVPFAWLVMLQVVWVNSHTMFVYGPAVVGLMLAIAAVARWMVQRGGPAWATPVRWR